VPGFFRAITNALFTSQRQTSPLAASLPGESGPSATVEVEPRTLGRLTTTYSPLRDGNADPGEIVWTWVPYQENDGRGKDRPVLVVAAEGAGTLIGVELTSKTHDGSPDYLFLGPGEWDAQRRDSWVKIDRVFRIHQAGLRREAASLDVVRFGAVRKALASRYGWR
jgi:PemK-like, MazF-like toxin of type II toxin-antitoxin system